ncbi:MAG: hypothetical protein LBV75_03170 [Paludibacter sp.]|jgi:hypothetical protein|nr:hypothetical protein [Paludibacter sp.]
MSIFNLYKARQYKYRYIYYDPKKESQQMQTDVCKDALNSVAAPENHRSAIIRKGVFRQMADHRRNIRMHKMHKSNIILLCCIVAGVIVLWLIISG